MGKNKIQKNNKKEEQERSLKENKKSPLENWKTALIGVMIGCLLTGFANYIIWKKQRSSFLQEKFFDIRFQIMKDVAYHCLNYQRLLSSKIKYALAKDYFLNGQSVNSLQEKRDYEKKLKEALPIEYKNGLESEKEFTAMMSSLLQAQLFFSQKTITNIQEYMIFFNDDIEKVKSDYIKKTINKKEEYSPAIKKDEFGNLIINFELNDVANFINSRLEKKLDKILNQMQKELQGNRMLVTELLY